MPIQKVTSGIIADGAIVATDIADGIVTNAKLAGSITGNKIATGQITGNLLTANCVSGNNIVSSPIITGNVTINGSLGIGGATPASSGFGITFPATQSASTDANTLDDYEEGTWTPIDNSGASLSFTYAGTARYTKIGRFVFVNLYINYPSTSNTANANIGGLPFTSSGGATFTYLVGRAGSLAVSIGQVNASTTEMGLFLDSDTAITNNQLSGTYVIMSGMLS